MERYYYHGIELMLDDEATSLEIMINIIKSGAIKTWTDLNKRNNEGMNHICLYRKNEEFDYEHREPFPIGPMSALDGWINNGIVFVILPEINAYKPIVNKNYSRSQNGTNIIDEWRTNENIPLEKIVGIALPLKSIEEMISDKQEYSQNWYTKLNQILSIAKEYGWFVANSEDKNFTDNLDEQLSKQISNSLGNN